MRLALDSDPRILLVRSYGGGEVVVGEQRIARPLIITPQRLILDWSATSFSSLAGPQLEALFALGAGIVLLGAGETQEFANAAVRASFRAHGIALECMTLGAACRTYNILASEERRVAAGLFP
ncbi:MAG TPA: MTH938/NDUFAF3 family protein [Steroidobacteraceae bacterium]